MIFSLEALEARHGDCLILHYGSFDDPRILVIDGGPHQVYPNRLKPRLLDIKENLIGDDPLPLSMVMVSHMDQDHVLGIVQMVEELREIEQDNLPLPFAIEHMWFNTFDDIVGNNEIAAATGFSNVASVADFDAALPQLAGLENHIKAVLASTNEGRRLRNSAEFLHILVNASFPPLAPNKPALVRHDAADQVIDWGDGLAIHVLHPNAVRLLEMQEKWDKDLKEAKEKGDNSIIIASAGARDDSPFNLASIVCLLEFEGKRILITGDGREDDIIEGLERAGLLDNFGRIHVDILKIPHHGSMANVTPEFFTRVTADHYVISADGRDENPDLTMLEMLSAATMGNDDFTLHLTNREGKENLGPKLAGFIALEQQNGRQYGIAFRADNELSLVINLLEEIDY
jgi:hypothetical protein